MCWLCDRAGATERDYLDHMRQLIQTYGWAVQAWNVMASVRPGTAPTKAGAADSRSWASGSRPDGGSGPAS